MLKKCAISGCNVRIFNCLLNKSCVVCEDVFIDAANTSVVKILPGLGYVNFDADQFNGRLTPFSTALILYQLKWTFTCWQSAW